MAFRVEWSAEADEEFRVILSYLKIEWGVRSADRFVLKISKKIKQLKDFPTMGRRSQKQAYLLSLKIDNHNFLLYEIRKERIIIHNLLPYKMDHSNDPRF